MLNSVDAAVHIERRSMRDGTVPTQHHSLLLLTQPYWRHEMSQILQETQPHSLYLHVQAQFLYWPGMGVGPTEEPRKRRTTVAAPRHPPEASWSVVLHSLRRGQQQKCAM